MSTVPSIFSTHCWLPLKSSAMVSSAFIVASDVNDAEVSPTFTYVLTTLGSPTFLCILGSRMFFNLKEAGEHGINVGTNWSSYHFTSIQFDDSQYAADRYVQLQAFFGCEPVMTLNCRFSSGLSTTRIDDTERGDAIEYVMHYWGHILSHRCCMLRLRSDISRSSKAKGKAAE